MMLETGAKVTVSMTSLGGYGGDSLQPDKIMKADMKIRKSHIEKIISFFEKKYLSIKI